MTDKAATSYYEVLEVSSNASAEEIDAAYQRLTSYLEPASLAVYSMIEDDEVSTMRDLVDEAYHTLSDPDRRAAYDNRLWAGDSEYPSLVVPEPHHGTSVTLGRVGDSGATTARPEPRAAARPAASEEAQRPSPLREEDARDDEAQDDGRGRSAATEADVARDQDISMGARSRAEAGPEEASGAEAESSEPAHPAQARPQPAGARQVPVERSGGDAGESRGQGAASPASSTASRARVRAASQRPRRLRPTRELPDLSSGIEVSGALLKGLRESAGATLEDVAEMTKISKRYLRALEDHDFELLPAPVYVRGFVAEYARVLGLDPQQFAASYMGLYRRYRGEGG